MANGNIPLIFLTYMGKCCISAAKTEIYSRK